MSTVRTQLGSDGKFSIEVQRCLPGQTCSRTGIGLRYRCWFTSPTSSWYGPGLPLMFLQHIVLVKNVLAIVYCSIHNISYYILELYPWSLSGFSWCCRVFSLENHYWRGFSVVMAESILKWPLSSANLLRQVNARARKDNVICDTNWSSTLLS